MNKKKTPAIVTALALCMVAQTNGLAAGFQDMPKESEWSYKALNYCLEKDYLKGVDSLHIAPQSPLTRAQMAAIMNRVKGTTEAADISRFSDVQAGDWFYNDIAKAVKAGFIYGRSEKEMAPNASITREEAFTILDRVLGDKTTADHLANYNDGKDVSAWAKKAVNRLIEEKTVTGDGMNLRPKANITREEFAQIIYMAVEKQEPLEKEAVKEKKEDKGKSSGSIGMITPSHDSKPEQKATVLYGDANVDQQQYPLVAPFVHPPFYNVRVKVTLDKDGKIASVEDDNTATKGLAPGTAQEFFNKKNKKFFDLLTADVYKKFVGKDRAGVEAMQMKSGEADAVSGATESGKALKQAVLNALDKKAGKKFLEKDQMLVAEAPVKTNEGWKIHFKNQLPNGFKVQLLSVNQGIYNGEKLLDAAAYSWKAEGDGFDLLLKDGNTPAGKYYVNIVDENNNYRSPDFESGHGATPKYPYFVIEKGANISYEHDKLNVPNNEFANFQQNIEEIEVIEWDTTNNKPVMVKGRDGKEVPKAVEIEPVGHHGTKSNYAQIPLFNTDGTVNKSVTAGRQPKPVFEEGKTYKIVVKTYGYGDTGFMYTAKKEEDQPGAGAKLNGEFTGKGAVAYRRYDFLVKVTMKDGKIVSAEDNGTQPKDSRSRRLHKRFIDNKGLAVYVGKTKEEAAAITKADMVSGATASSNAAKAAIQDALK